MRVDGLVRDKTRPPRIPPLEQAVLDRVVALTNTDPPHEATHWTAGSMAMASGVSTSTVHRIWRAHQLRPHRFGSFKLSRDPALADKVQDVVGLYVDPPAHAVVLSIDEKSQIQALDRTQPGLPIKPGRLGTMTHDDNRHGTTSLFATMDVKAGTIVGTCMPRHRALEFRRFLDTVENTVPADLDIHVILDNASSHKTKLIRAWLARHPRWTLHFTPTSCYWLNAVEGFFAKLTKRRLQRGVFRSIVKVQAAINRFLEEANHHPKPFVWTPTPDKIIGVVKRGNQTLGSIH